MRAEAVAMALCVQLLAGCAGNPRVNPPVTAIVSDAPVAFEVVMGQPAAGKAAVRNTAKPTFSGSGAAAGAVAGGLYGLACGPFALICVPATMLVGAGVGGVVGMTAGLAQAVPKEKRIQLEDRLKRMQQTVDPLVELRTEVLERAGRHWQLTEDTSMSVVTLEVQRLYLTSYGKENISLVMEVLVSQRNGEVGNPSRPPRRYAVVSQGAGLAMWLDELSDLPETQLRTACEQIATQVVAELLASN